MINWKTDEERLRNGRLWEELFGLWLTSIGGEVKEPHYFHYKNMAYYFCASDGMVRILSDGHPWDATTLSIGDIEPCNPSFDPNKCFRPLKKWMKRLWWRRFKHWWNLTGPRKNNFRHRAILAKRIERKRLSEKMGVFNLPKCGKND